MPLNLRKLRRRQPVQLALHRIDRVLFGLIQIHAAIQVQDQPAAVSRSVGEFVRVLNLPEVRERLSSAGAEPVGNTPAAFAAQIRNDGEKYGKLAAELGLKLD